MPQWNYAKANNYAAEDFNTFLGLVVVNEINEITIKFLVIPFEKKFWTKNA